MTLPSYPIVIHTPTTPYVYTSHIILFWLQVHNRTSGSGCITYPRRYLGTYGRLGVTFTPYVHSATENTALSNRELLRADAKSAAFYVCSGLTSYTHISFPRLYNNHLPHPLSFSNFFFFFFSHQIRVVEALALRL